jgi:AcrR family transcriptional regulator
VPRALREEQMLDVATRLFAEHGFRDASMDEIAEQCGITKPMLYAYFESKEGLFTASAERGSERLRQAVRAATEGAAKPDVRLWRGLLAVFEFVDENRESWAVLYPYGPTSAGPFAATAGRARDAMAELVAELFAELAPAGDADPTAAPAVNASLAHALTGATIALASWSLDHPEESREEHAMRLMNFAWMGLRSLRRGRTWAPPAKG